MKSRILDSLFGIKELIGYQLFKIKPCVNQVLKNFEIVH